jgi:predicted nucleotidyltransferase component of viral defense system
MYQILGKISTTNAPIVFKGALVTKLVLQEQGYSGIERATTDIDANWIGTPPTSTELVETVNQSLNDFQGKLYAKAEREYSDTQTAGVTIFERESGDKLIKMDIDIKGVLGYKNYYYGEFAIRGVLIDEILADKISVLSSPRIFRRAKDVVDVYALSKCTKANALAIIDACNKRGHILGNFNGFIEQREQLEHAYNKLKRITGKPPFNDVYSHLIKFLQPFIDRQIKDLSWNHAKSEWSNPQPTTNLNNRPR